MIDTESSPPESRLMRLTEGGTPVLVGQRCRRCGRVAFPPDPYGCEACGAGPGELDPQDLAASGTVHAVAVVHRHHREFPPTPFTVASILLDDGPQLKAVLVEDSADAAVGERVGGVAEPEGSPLPLRFGRSTSARNEGGA
jgi:uncharacterized protein